MLQPQEINRFLSSPLPLLDVRSPSEFIQGHLHGAYSLPLFSDVERAQVGTLYKQQGKEAAVKLGLQFVGPKLVSFVDEAEKIASPLRSVRLYCARGGMRSGSLAWLLQTAGFQCTLLAGGYKTYRQWVFEQFRKSYSFIVLGGLTGSGKTGLLRDLESNGEQVIDLEKLAGHRGSSFGHLGCPRQLSSEHFENRLAYQLVQLDSNRPIWIEDESRAIGNCYLPLDLWNQMQLSPFVWIECSKAERIQRLLEDYGGYAPEGMILATQRLVKKLGAVRTKQAVQAIQDNDLRTAISIVLEYYDHAYTYACQRRERRFNQRYSISDPKLIEGLKKIG